MLSHEQVKRIVLEHFRKAVKKGKMYVSSYKMDDAARELRRNTSEYSVKQLQELEKATEKKLVNLQDMLKSISARIETEYIKRIRSGEITEKFLAILKTYVDCYNEFKIQAHLLDEIKLMIYGDTPQKKAEISKETKIRERNSKKINLSLASGNEFLRRGGGWIIRFNAKQENVVPHRIGLTYIAYLLETPNEFHHCDSLLSLELERGAHFGELDGDHDARNAMKVDVKINTSMKVHNQQTSFKASDPKTTEKYKERIRIITEKLAEDPMSEDEITKLEDERDRLVDLIVNSGPRGKIKSKDDDRKKKSVAKAITDAINTIREYDEELADHLHNSITSGINVIYGPTKDISWIIERFPPKKLKK